MDVHDLGEGEPEVAVVGAIHGDEPCGARAVRRLSTPTSTSSAPCG